MLGTALVAFVLLVAVQGLLVVKLADKLTPGTTGGRNGAVPAAGRYAQYA